VSTVVVQAGTLIGEVLRDVHLTGIPEVEGNTVVVRPARGLPHASRHRIPLSSVLPFEFPPPVPQVKEAETGVTLNSLSNLTKHNTIDDLRVHPRPPADGRTDRGL
jgi:hypothetical protein